MPDQRVLHAWWADSNEELTLQTIRAAWPGWSIRLHGDRFESQLQLTGEALTLPASDESRLLDDLLARLRSDLIEVKVAQAEREGAIRWLLKRTGRSYVQPRSESSDSTE